MHDRQLQTRLNPKVHGLIALPWALSGQWSGLLGILSHVSIAIIISTPAIAQTITPANDGTATTVTPNEVTHQISITGGQISGDGRNLFHSFQDFGLRPIETAIFQTSPTIDNVLGRVTGGTISFIDGELAIAGSQANLYLINPAGVVFGSNASLNIPGDFTVTTADAISFGEGAWWSATNSVTNSGSSGADWTNFNGDPSGFVFRLAEPGVIVNGGNLAIAAGSKFWRDRWSDRQHWHDRRTRWNGNRPSCSRRTLGAFEHSRKPFKFRPCADRRPPKQSKPCTHSPTIANG